MKPTHALLPVYLIAVIFLIGKADATNQNDKLQAEQQRLRQSVLDIAALFAQEKTKEAGKIAKQWTDRLNGRDDIAEVYDLECLLGRRRPKPRKDTVNGFGYTHFVSIDAALRSLARDKRSEKYIKTNGKELQEMAYRIAAASAIIELNAMPRFSGKKRPAKDRADWIKFSRQARTQALALAHAARARDADALQTAARGVDVQCVACHAVFRD